MGGNGREMASVPSDRQGQGFGYTAVPAYSADALQGSMLRHESRRLISSRAGSASPPRDLANSQFAPNVPGYRHDGVTDLDPAVAKFSGSGYLVARPMQYGFQCGPAQPGNSVSVYPTMHTYGYQTSICRANAYPPTPLQANRTHDVYGEHLGSLPDGVTRLSPGVARYCTR